MANSNPSWTEAYNPTTSSGPDYTHASAYASREETSATGNVSLTGTGSGEEAGIQMITINAKQGVDFSISESLSVSETTTTLRTRLFTVSESLALSETISALKGISFTIAESLGLVEAFTCSRTRLFIIADSLNVVEVKAYVQKKWSNVAKSTVATVTNGVKTAVSVITNTPKS